MPELGIPEKSKKNVAQRCWPEVRRTLRSKVMAKIDLCVYFPMYFTFWAKKKDTRIQPVPVTGSDLYQNRQHLTEPSPPPAADVICGQPLIGSNRMFPNSCLPSSSPFWQSTLLQFARQSGPYRLIWIIMPIGKTLHQVSPKILFLIGKSWGEITL